MSNTNGYNSLTKSMNGIITVSDGMGGTMEDGQISCITLNATNFDCNNIQGITPTDAITLYTNSTNTISLGKILFTGNEITSTNVLSPFVIGGANMPNFQTIEIGLLQAATRIGNPTLLTNTFISNWEFYNNTLNLIAGYSSAIVEICDRLTDGTLNLGSGITSGNINIGGSNANIGSINIGREMLNGIIRIASNATNTSIYFGNDGNSGTINFNTNSTLNLGPYSKTINIGTKQFLSTDIINIGNGLTGSAGMNINCKGTLNVGANSNIINIGTSMTTGPITIGTATVPIIGPYVCTASTHLANKQYVDNGIQALLSLTNIWTGVSNTFNNTIIGNTITATAVSSTISLFNNLTTGALNIATGITNGNIIIGSHSTIGATGSLTLKAKNSVEIGSAAASIYLGIGSPSINIGNSIVGGTPTIDIGTTAFSTINLNGNFGKAIKPTYGYVANVGTPTGCIGNYFGPTSAISANFTLVSTQNKVGATFTNLPIGVWMLYWNCVVYSPTTTASLTSINLFMGTTAGGSDIFTSVVDVGNVPVGLNKTYLITQIYTNTDATTDISFSITATFSGTLTLLPQYGTTFCKAVRLA